MTGRDNNSVAAGGVQRKSRRAVPSEEQIEALLSSREAVIKRLAAERDGLRAALVEITRKRKLNAVAAASMQAIAFAAVARPNGGGPNG